MRSVDFEYETVKGDLLEVFGQVDQEVTFKAYKGNKKVKKKELTALDIKNIKEFILDNAEEDTLYDNFEV